MKVKTYECPLCHSKLSEARYLEIVGVWQEQEKFKESLKARLAEVDKAKKETAAMKVKLAAKYQKQLDIERSKTNKRISQLTRQMNIQIQTAGRRERRADEDRRRLVAALEKVRKEAKEAEKRGEKKAEKNSKKLMRQLEARIADSQKESLRARKEMASMQRDFTSKIREVKKAALKEGAAKIKKANERVLKTVKDKDSKIEGLNKEIKQLHEQIRKGITQQQEGFNFEKTLAAELSKRFSTDTVRIHGKGGDILQTVREASKDIGAILYECKKSENWQNSFLIQVKKDMASRGANYGVVVTFALPKSQRGFMVRSGVCFVHPYGALYLADMLRTAIIEAHKTKVSPGKVEQRLKDLMFYIQGNRFKGAIRQIVGETEELVQAMKNEIQGHRRYWSDRYIRYKNIYDTASKVRSETAGIIKGDGSDQLERQGFAGFLPMPSLAQDK